jgi:hypothetical protein
VWILEVDDQAMAGADRLASLNVLFPYASEDRAVANLVNRRSRYEWLKRLSEIYAYSSLLLAHYDRRAAPARASRRAYDPLDRRGLGVLAVRSPVFARGPLDREFERAEAARLRAAFGAFGVQFLDFAPEACPALGDAQNFRDRAHLNRLGAGRFRAILADSMPARRLIPARGIELGSRGAHDRPGKASGDDGDPGQDP